MIKFLKNLFNNKNNFPRKYRKGELYGFRFDDRKSLMSCSGNNNTFNVSCPVLYNGMCFENISQAQEHAKDKSTNKNELPIELVNGAKIIVELWDPKSPAQKKWKKDWLKKTEKFL